MTDGKGFCARQVGPSTSSPDLVRALRLATRALLSRGGRYQRRHSWSDIDMTFKATLYQLAFNVARVTVIGKEHEHQMQHALQRRSTLPRLGGEGQRSAPLRLPRRAQTGTGTGPQRDAHDRHPTRARDSV